MTMTMIPEVIKKYFNPRTKIMYKLLRSNNPFRNVL